MRTQGSIMALTLAEFHGYAIPEHIRVLHLSNSLYDSSNRSTCIFPEWLKFVVLTTDDNLLRTDRNNRTPIIINPQRMGFYTTDTVCGYNVPSNRFIITLRKGSTLDLDPITYDDLVLIEEINKLDRFITLVDQAFAEKRQTGRTVGVAMSDEFYVTELSDIEAKDDDLVAVLCRYCKDDFNRVDADNMMFRETVVQNWILSKTLTATDKAGYLRTAYGIYIKYPGNRPKMLILSYISNKNLGIFDKTKWDADYTVMRPNGQVVGNAQSYYEFIDLLSDVQQAKSEIRRYHATVELTNAAILEYITRYINWDPKVEINGNIIITNYRNANARKI
jgi:hypothetical protein